MCDLEGMHGGDYARIGEIVEAGVHWHSADRQLTVRSEGALLQL